MKFIPYQSDHLRGLRDFGCQEYLRANLELLMKIRYEDHGPCYTGLIDDTPVACAGLFEVTPYRASVWALMANMSNPMSFIAIHRAVKAMLDAQEYKRVDAHVRFDDVAGHRWMKLLGFRREVYCRPWYNIDGSSMSEYVR